MNKLIRRVAAGLALPLAIGAPVVLLAGPAHAAGMTITTLALPATAVYGQEVRATATGSSSSPSSPPPAAANRCRSAARSP